MSVNFNIFGIPCEITCEKCNGTKLVQVIKNVPCKCQDTQCEVCWGTGYAPVSRSFQCSDCDGTGIVLTPFGKEVLAFLTRNLAVAGHGGSLSNPPRLYMYKGK